MNLMWISVLLSVQVRRLQMKEMCNKSKKDKSEAWAPIHYLQKKGITRKEIHDNMLKTLVEDSTSYATAKKHLWNSSGAETAPNLTHG